jgi:carbonic anhydrase
VGVIDDLVANNEAFAASLPFLHRDVRPSRELAIVTCMDSRLDVFAALGLGEGEAHILRNAGGVVTDFLLHRDDVRGFVYDVDSHRLREIAV